MHEKKNLPRVLPPPLYYGAAFLIGFLLNRWAPLDFPATVLSEVAGLLLILLSLLLVFSAIPQFRKHGTSVDVYKPTTTLVTSGVFRFTRNPMYLSLTLLYIGLSILFDNLWIFLMVVPAVLMVSFLNIRREEGELEAQFGDDYRDYKRRVRRWI